MTPDHEHQFPEEETPHGVRLLLPCLLCGLPAADGMVDVTRERDERNTEIERLDAQIEELQAEIERLQRGRETLVTEIDTLMAEIERLRKELRPMTRHFRYLDPTTGKYLE